MASHKQFFGAMRSCCLLMFCSLLITQSIICTNALPKPQGSYEDDDSNFATYAATKGAPLITPASSYVTLDPKTHFNLRCEANEPIVWRTLVGIEAPNTTDHTRNPTRKYRSTLQLSDITADHVGYYYCVKESALINDNVDYSELVENYNAAKIYVYVNDSDALLVPMNVPVINAMQYDDVVIPCKPTMPDTVVELITPNQEVFPSDTTGRYDPKRGFIVQIQQIHETGVYRCRPQTPLQLNEDEESEILVLYLGNEYNDREFAPICDVFPINRNNRNNNINCTVLASEIPLNNNNHTLSNLSPVNNTNFFFQPNNNYNNNNNNNNTNNTFNNIHPNASNVKNLTNILVNAVTSNRRRTTRSFTSSFLSTEPTNSIGVVDAVAGGGGSSSKSSSSLDSEDVTMKEGEYNNDDDSREDVNDDDDDDDKDADDDNVDVDDSKRLVGVGITRGGGGNGLSLSTKFFQFTTESGYGVRMGKRDTTNSHRGRSYRIYGSTPRSKTTHVNRPEISSESYGHAVEGGSFELVCTVEVPHGVRFEITWETPLDDDPKSISRKNASKTIREEFTDTYGKGRSILIVKNTQKSDEGYYKCFVRDNSNNFANNSYLMTILKKGESYINISEPSNYYTIKTNASKSVQMNVKYRGYPNPLLNWYAPNGKLIQPGKKYDVNLTAQFFTLRINETNLNDTGVYILRASNGIDEKELKFNVYIKDKPQVSIENVYVQAGQDVQVLCKTLSYPPAKVIWTYTPCKIKPKWPTCEGRQKGFNSTRNSANGESEIERIHELIFKPESPGNIRCIATNQMGAVSGRALVLMGDLTANMTVYGVDENSKIARGDEVIMTCAALVYYYTDDLDWFKDGQIIYSSNSVEVQSSFSDYSYKKTIKFKNIEKSNEGSYECRARYIENYTYYDSKFQSFVVHEPSAPTMPNTDLGGKTKRVKLGESLELICKPSGIPKAVVIWYKDDVKLNSENNIFIEEDNSVLRIPFIKPEDQGLYKCVASNRLGAVEASSQVTITDLPGLKLGWILGIIAIIVILIIFVISLGFRILKDRQTFRQMQLAGLANFEEGALEQINPAMSLDEQADLLPYDRRFEFPKDKLKLGKKLGAGAFGVVLKAYAEGIVPDEKETVVAVKMVKRTADNEVIKALVSELKIMVHLGQHLNVVNLLGAVTKDIAKREVMVIVEYCRYGNVQNFLLRNRKHFINQINPMTDKIDPTITQQRYSADFEINRNSENDPRSGTRAGRPNSSGYLRQSDLYEGNVDSCATEQTVMTTIPEGEDNVLSNNSVQPAWRSNYKPDTTETMSVTTSNLVSWAFQVARGMDYLSSRKVLHGDLAARNILLCEGNVVKICDFGLARSMYKSDNYKKQGEAPLPIKWLALESLSDQVFSTYTDVWSFGIVLWEFFSLAKVPYPGMVANQSLYLKLKDGYRMEQPPYANQELYDIMLECWSANPESRPLFNELEKKFAKLLGDEVTNHYVDLNEPYLRMNTEYLKEKDTDYLALMGSPDEMAPPPPRYVNGMILPEIRIDPSDDYLQMSPKAEQHSPTTTNNLDSPVMKTRKKIGVPPEEIPMLTKSTDGVQRECTQSDSDSEHSPSPQMSARTFAQVNRTPGEIETSLTGPDGNYVNVKPVDLSKKYINSNGIKDGVSNPSYSMLKTVKEGRK